MATEDIDWSVKFAKRPYVPTTVRHALGWVWTRRQRASHSGNASMGIARAKR